MRAIVMEGPGKSKVVEVDMPVINDNELLVKVKYTGMCHSEWYPWSTANKGDRLGHEPVGVVEKVGKNVKGFKVGDRVTGLGAGYAEYIKMDPNTTVHVPDNLSDEDAIAEPLSCLISAVSRIPVNIPGEAIAVVGAGYMGLGTISLLRMKGATHIVAVDPRKEARENALKFGAVEAYAPDELPDSYKLDWNNFGFYFSDENSGDKKVDIFTTGFRTVVEFAGTEEALRLAGDMVSAHGLLGVGGYHNDVDRTVDFKLWNVKAFDLVNCHERRTDLQTEFCRRGLELLSSGDWNFKGVANHIYEMEDFDKANFDMVNKDSKYIKALIKCS